MLDALKTQLSLLTAGPRDAPARQRTLRDTIAWNYELLSPADRDMLQGLGVFSGGFTADAVASIFGVSLAETIDRLAALVDSSLVLPSPTPLTAAMRYRLLDPVREFAFERLTESGRLHGIQLAHARYFTQFAEDSVPLYDGPELPKALRATCAEVDNFRVAMAFSFSDGHVEDGVRLAGALWRHWPSLYMSEQEGWHDRLQEGLRWIETALEHRDGLPFDAVREALIGQIFLNAHLGDYEHLQELADALMAQAMDEGDNYGIYWGAYSQWRASIDITQPVQQIEEALEWLSGFARGTRQPVNQEAGVYLAMGEVLIMQCQERDAGPVITRAHDLALESGNPLYISSTTQLLGDLALERHDLISALGRFRECLLLQNPLGNPSGLYFTITRVAMVALAAGREDLALRLLASQPVQHRAAHLFEARNHQQFLEKLRKVAGDAPVDQALHSQHLLSDGERDRLLDELDAHLQARPLQSTPASPGPSLTPRELEVLTLLANGASNRSIADSLFISERTVENHVQHIFTKLDVSNRSGATAWAIRNGLA